MASLPTILVSDEPLMLPPALSSTSLPTHSEGEPPRKIQRQGSRIKSALQSLTNSRQSPLVPYCKLGDANMCLASNNSVEVTTTWPRNSPEPPKRSSEKRHIIKRLSLPFLWKPFGSAVPILYRKSTKPRPSLPSLETQGQSTNPTCAPGCTTSPSDRNSNSNSTSNATSSGKSSGQTHATTTTAKTSLDSKLSSRDHGSSDKRSTTVIRSERPEGSAVPDLSLTTIQETALDLASPTILTVEKAAAAKIYLELYFNEHLNKPTPRSLRRRHLEVELYHSNGLTLAEKNIRLQIFYKQETDHLRETRALKAKSLVTTQENRTTLADNYEVLKILGKGSFGVVRLVREKTDVDSIAHNLGHERRVYAMKVIRKSAMLRTSQEGHLRAERDFLVASEGSRWCVVPLYS